MRYSLTILPCHPNKSGALWFGGDAGGKFEEAGVKSFAAAYQLPPVVSFAMETSGRIFGGVIKKQVSCQLVLGWGLGWGLDLCLARSGDTWLFHEGVWEA